MSDRRVEVPWKVDTVTGLPWFTAIHGEMAGRALDQDLHVVDILLAGLARVSDRHGAAALAAMLRDVARRAAGLLDDRDQLGRYGGDRLLLVTTRPAAEVRSLIKELAARIDGAGAQIDDVRAPRVHAGVARILRASDYAQAAARLDAAILSAELSAVPVPAEPPAATPKALAEESTTTPEPAVVAPASAAAPRTEAGLARRTKRAVLTSLRLDLSGLVATAIVELSFGHRRTVARSVGRNAEERRLFLIGEATARAVTDLLPSGYGAVIHEVKILQPGTPEQGKGILSSVLFLTPDDEQFLFGVAPAGGDPRLATARAMLSAVNRKIEPLLGAVGA